MPLCLFNAHYPFSDQSGASLVNFILQFASNDRYRHFGNWTICLMKAGQPFTWKPVWKQAPHLSILSVTRFLPIDVVAGTGSLDTLKEERKRVRLKCYTVGEHLEK